MSKIETNGPPSALAVMIPSTGPLPIPLIAPNPKRTAPSLFTVN